MAIEKAPLVSQEALQLALLSSPNGEVSDLVTRINDSFEYWDTVKYKRCPAGCTPQQLWTYVKAARMKSKLSVWKKYGITLTLTNQMQRLCHEIDRNWGGIWGTGDQIGAEQKAQYLVGSLMEESIFSSQMEGAATTRKVAKEMLRKKMMPKDKSQRMIANNYQTIQFIVSHKDTPLSPALLLQIHQLMTAYTMQNPQDSGCFRRNNDVVVENGITHETVHTPPSYQEIPHFVDDLCQFFNEEDAPEFIHPIIRGIVIHFMTAYVHPFADGNGRTARALFYWYMLKQGYWLTEYLSISRVIAKSKKSYEKAFLYTESDGMDLGYFVAYNMKVLQQSFQQLQDYIKRKEEEKQAANTFLRIGNINARQAQVIKMFADHPKTVVCVSDLQAKFSVSPTTAKTDLVGLVERGLLTEISFNKVKKGYIKGRQFDSLTQHLEV